jgi:hypothetical protein
MISVNPTNITKKGIWLSPYPFLSFFETYNLRLKTYNFLVTVVLRFEWTFNRNTDILSLVLI